MHGTPKVRQLRLSQRAAFDLLEIDRYYAGYGAATAARVVGEIRKAVVQLLDHPHIGSPGIAKGTRHKIVVRYPYTIVYRVKPAVIQIVRVLHQRRRYFNPRAE